MTGSPRFQSAFDGATFDSTVDGLTNNYQDYINQNNFAHIFCGLASFQSGVATAVAAADPSYIGLPEAEDKLITATGTEDARSNIAATANTYLEYCIFLQKYTPCEMEYSQMTVGNTNTDIVLTGSAGPISLTTSSFNAVGGTVGTATTGITDPITIDFSTYKAKFDPSLAGPAMATLSYTYTLDAAQTEYFLYVKLTETGTALAGKIQIFLNDELLKQ